MLDLRIVGGTVVSDGRSRPADVGVDGELITEVSPTGGLGSARREIDASGLLVIPGAVDAHFHCRAPSNPERATFASESRAAASAGVTTLFEMPIANPPCSTPEAFELRQGYGEAESLVDFALYGGAGITDPARAEAMAELGAIGFKLFTHTPPAHRMVDFEGLWASGPEEIYDCLRTVGATGLRCAVHAESQQFIERFSVDPDRFGHPSRPPMVEAAAVGLVATAIRDLGIPAHIVHITSRMATEEVQAAQALGVDLSAESCPHYLLFDESLIPRLGNFVKVAPPLRPPEDVAYLWEALNGGSLSVVASDHAPFTPEEKAAADFATTGQGIPSLEMLVPTMIDAGLTGRLPLARAVEVMTANPAKLFGIYPRKGTVSPGSEADLVLIDPKARLIADSSRFLSRSGGSGKAYDGLDLSGRILTTLSRGRVVYDKGQVAEGAGGKLVSPDGPPRNVTETQTAAS
ncbi:MAG: dihydroorotase family protein [Acidimicrobiia bacterium]|nr:dihydroorotase family protein [Acidimicrobiia bacterium]